MKDSKDYQYMFGGTDIPRKLEELRKAIVHLQTEYTNLEQTPDVGDECPTICEIASTIRQANAP